MISSNTALVVNPSLPPVGVHTGSTLSLAQAGLLSTTSQPLNLGINVPTSVYGDVATSQQVTGLLPQAPTTDPQHLQVVVPSLNVDDLMVSIYFQGTIV